MSPLSGSNFNWVDAISIIFTERFSSRARIHLCKAIIVIVIIVAFFQRPIRTSIRSKLLLNSEMILLITYLKSSITSYARLWIFRCLRKMPFILMDLCNHYFDMKCTLMLSLLISLGNWSGRKKKLLAALFLAAAGVPRGEPRRSATGGCSFSSSSIPKYNMVLSISSCQDSF